jgi:hypothetical protein
MASEKKIMRIKKLPAALLCLAIAFSFAATLGVALGAPSGETASAYDTTIDDWGLDYFDRLDTGIYWYTSESDIPTSDYTVKGDKPTVIFTHGLKQNEGYLREGLSLKQMTETQLAKNNYDDYPYDPYFYNYYLELGYNVGIFYWNQLADDTPACDVKIWSSDNVSYGMRYRKFSSADDIKGTLTEIDDPTNPKSSVAVLYGEAIKSALGNDFSGTLQLIGHSMGGQLTCAVSEYLCLQYDAGEIGENLLPDRVTLLDPYFTAVSKVTGTVDHTGESVKKITTAQLAAEATTTIHDHGIPIEAYGANKLVFQLYAQNIPGIALDEEEVNSITSQFEKNCVWVYIKGIGTYFSLLTGSHVIAEDYYFTTNNFEPTTVDGIPVPSARQSIENLQMTIGMTFIQECDNGEESLYMNRCSFVRGDFATLEAIDTEEESTGRIYGTIDASNKNKEIQVKIYGSDGKEVGSADVSKAGYYYVDGLADGTYTMTIYADYMPASEVKDIIVVNGQITVLPVQQVIVGGDKMLFISLIGILAVIAAVVIGGLISKIVKKRKNAKCEAKARQ